MDSNASSITNASTIAGRAAWFAMAAIAAAFLCLVALHVLSPEFHPSWRMVSEYAFGHYGWVLSLMFLAWGVSTWALAAAIWSQIQTKAGKLGAWLLIVAGLGEAMASVFDITHDVGHSVAGILGVLGFPIAAMLVSASLDHTPAWSSMSKKLRHGCAHLTWISVVLLVASLILMTVQVAHANGGRLPQHAPAALPAGVIGFDGWADRLVILSSFLWATVVARQAIRVRCRGAGELT
ncbi:MAG: DUF998 domain-containing protein [Gammaproteobacteria bacterium]